MPFTVFRLVRGATTVLSQRVPVRHRCCVNKPYQNVVVYDVLSPFPRDRNVLFLCNCAFNSRNQLGSAPKHFFQFLGCQSPPGPQQVVVEGKDLSQTRRVVSDLVRDATLVCFVKLGETLSKNEAQRFVLRVVGLHCEGVLNK